MGEAPDNPITTHMYLGVGGGLMLSTYTFPNDTANARTGALEVAIGFRAGIVDLSYSPRFTFPEKVIVNHKLQLGFRIIPYL